jgi:hypothetical protein
MFFRFSFKKDNFKLFHNHFPIPVSTAKTLSGGNLVLSDTVVLTAFHSSLRLKCNPQTALIINETLGQLGEAVFFQL